MSQEKNTAGRSPKGYPNRGVCVRIEGVKNNPKTRNQCTVYERNGQLVFALNSEKMIPENAPLRLASAMLEELDYEKLYGAYSPLGRKSAADPRVLFKVLVFGYMCGIYSTRKLEQACRKNIDFIWLLQGERVPDHTSFARFRSGKARQAIEDLFYQFVKRLAAEQEIEYEEVFIDGTKIESMANRYTFVWRKSVDRQLTRVKEKARELFYRYGGKGKLTTGKLRSLAASLVPEGGEMVHGTGRRKPLWQQQYEEIDQLLERWKKYEAQLFEMGCRRNSLSKTDKDATPIFIFPVTCDNTDTSAVPTTAAPFPQISYSPKYSPDFSAGIILAK